MNISTTGQFEGTWYPGLGGTWYYPTSTTTCSITVEATINVYVDDGTVYYYTVSANTGEELNRTIREHHHAIITNGYRSCKDGILISYPSHRISKVNTKHPAVQTAHPDNVRGT